MYVNFLILTIHKPSLGSCEVPQKEFGWIGSADLTFIGHKQTDKHSIYIYSFSIYIDCKEIFLTI